MAARSWLTLVALLGSACFFSLVGMIAASDTDANSRAAALAVAQVGSFILVTGAVVRGVVVAQPFAPARSRPAFVLAAAPAAGVASAAALALLGVEVTLSLAWIGLLAIWGVMTWATTQHGRGSAIVAAVVGWWVVCGGAIAAASIAAILDPDRGAARSSFTESGNDLVVVLSLFAFVLLVGATAAGQLVVLALARARQRGR